MLPKKTCLSLGALCVVLSFSNCFYPYGHGGENWQQLGYRPVYGSADELKISWEDAREVNNPGKIYIYGSYLLINEVGMGIHVYNNADPSKPDAVGYIRIPGNSNMAIKNDILYADHAGELVALSISDFNSMVERGRLPIASWELGVPPPSQSYYECADAGKGIVVAWKEFMLKNPECYAD